jgi:hypothetical protein
MNRDPITTVQIQAPLGCSDVEVYFFPGAAYDAAPVWVRLGSQGASAFTCLTLHQAQQLCAGLHEVIAAKLQTTR